MEDHVIEELRHRLKDYVQMVTKPSRSAGRDKFICPLPGCGSGTGRNKTGAFSITPDGKHWSCFSCNRSGSIFDLIGLLENKPTFTEQAARAAEIFGTAGTYAPPATITPKPQPERRQAQPGTFTDYITSCAAAAGKTDYFTGRSFTAETISRFNLGYDETKRQIVIPYDRSNSYYIARSTTSKKYFKPKAEQAGAEPVYNAAALTGDQPCFVTEGPLDAISIMQAGGTAIAIGGTGRPKLIAQVKKTRPTAPLILSLDNDEAGQDAAAKLAADLDALGISYITAAYSLDKYQGGTKDANDLLIANEGQLMQDIKDNVARAQGLEEPAQDLQDTAATTQEQTPEDAAAAEILAEINRHKVGCYMDNFWDYIRDETNNKPIPTGFADFDEAIGGGLFPRLYIIGAVPSLGKTTFALQIADHIAAGGRDVIIFSLEMAKEDILARSISRHTYLLADDERNAKTELGILDGSRWRNYSTLEKRIIGEAFGAYREYADEYISIYEGRHTADQIQQTVKQYVETTGKRPVVIVDYIQIIQPTKETQRADARAQVDYNVDVLAAIRRELKTPVIGISSFNRGSYNTTADSSSFKESGTIEYSGDCVITLELEYEKVSGNADKTRENFRAAMAANPRQIKLTFQKNRGNKVGTVLNFNYFPAFNFFNPAPKPITPAKQPTRII